MSIATLKKKAKYNYSNHSGPNGFSLNSARRLDSNKDSIQTLMRGTGYKSSGMTGTINVVKSQYVNYDIPGVPRPTNKNNRGLLSHKLRWLSGGYPNNVVKTTNNNKPEMGYETYMAKLHLIKKDIINQCSRCTENKDVAKDLVPPSYEIYLKTRFLEKKCLPLPLKDSHYPPFIPCNSAQSNCINNFTYEEYLDTLTCEKN
jgi:hypothetical protein